MSFPLDASFLFEREAKHCDNLFRLESFALQTPKAACRGPNPRPRLVKLKLPAEDDPEFF